MQATIYDNCFYIALVNKKLNISMPNFLKENETSCLAAIIIIFILRRTCVLSSHGFNEKRNKVPFKIMREQTHTHTHTQTDCYNPLPTLGLIVTTTRSD